PHSCNISAKIKIEIRNLLRNLLSHNPQVPGSSPGGGTTLRGGSTLIHRLWPSRNSATAM
ncbi:hypothetical protein, partial [Mycobacterium sp. RTGN3]|uniref:hypothetical protein n=1 Tax=Mycobacterium sp. RTGN3 TaxID=3016524 RepID=UPI0029C84B48